MEPITVYYEEEKESCRKYAELFSQHDKVTCRKISEWSEENILYEENQRVGFLFESEREKVPAAVLQVIRRLVMKKAGKCFVYVTGGSRELTARKEELTAVQMRQAMHKEFRQYKKYRKKVLKDN